MILRFLLGCLLLEALVAGAMGLVAWGSGLLLQEKWRTEAQLVQGDLNRCWQQRETDFRRWFKGGR